MSAIRLSFFKSVHFYYIHSLGGASPGLNIPGRSNNLGSHTFEGIICKTIAIDSLGMSCGVSLEEELRYYGGKIPNIYNSTFSTFALVGRTLTSTSL